jgi:hypothetical protein
VPFEEVRTTPAPAPWRVNDPSKFMHQYSKVQGLLPSDVGAAVSSIGSTSGTGVHSAMKSASAWLLMACRGANRSPNSASSMAHLTVRPIPSLFWRIWRRGYDVTTVILCA